MLRLLSIIVIALSIIVVPVSASCAPVATASDTCNVIKPFIRPFLLSLTYGRRINTGGNDNGAWFGRQRPTHSDLSLRMTGFLCRHWGIYGEMLLGGSENWYPPIGNFQWVEDFQCGAIINAIGFGCGLMYRYESGRWQFFVRSGCGTMVSGHADYLIDRSVESSSIMDEIYGYEDWMAHRWCGTNLYVNSGITVGYLVTRVTSLLFDLNYRYPIIKNSNMYISQELGGSYYNPGITTEWRSTSRSWCNNLTVSIGLQLQCELSGTRKNKKRNK